MMMLFSGVIVVVLAVVVWQFINDSESPYKQKRKGIPQTVRDILDERYANDEISRDEYFTMLEDIETNKQYR